MNRSMTAILKALSIISPHYWQRVDGLYCNPEINGMWWVRYRFNLWRLQRLKLIERTYINHSIFPSVNKLPHYRITTTGRELLRPSA